MKRAVLFVGHGTRCPAGLDEFRSLVTQVVDRVRCGLADPAFACGDAKWLPDILFDHAYLELQEPSIGTALARSYARGARHVLLVPVFLFAAGHIKHDIPASVRQAETRLPGLHVDVLPPVGVDPAFIETAVHRLREAGLVPTEATNAAVLLVGRGNRDPKAQAEFDQVAAAVQRLTAVCSVHTCYLAGTGRPLQEALPLALSSGVSTLFVLPYLWFQGHVTRQLHDHIARWQELQTISSVDMRVAPHLGIDERIVERMAVRTLTALKHLAAPRSAGRGIHRPSPDGAGLLCI